jgi:hypothetical protein
MLREEIPCFAAHFIAKCSTNYDLMSKSTSHARMQTTMKILSAHAVLLTLALNLIALPGLAQKTIRPAGVLLPQSKAATLLKQCSRPTPQGVDGDWGVPKSAIDRLERDLAKIKSLKSGMFGPRRSVSEPGAYFRQYAGITIQGKRYVYISAVRTGEPLPNWRSEPMILCDGGESAWGALYDPSTGNFSQFEFNGSI